MVRAVHKDWATAVFALLKSMDIGLVRCQAEPAVTLFLLTATQKNNQTDPTPSFLSLNGKVQCFVQLASFGCSLTQLIFLKDRFFLWDWI